MSDRTPENLIQDIIDFCQETIQYVEGVDLDDFLEDKQRQRAVERTLELIGEVANRLGDDRPQIGIPWDQVISLRVLLAHVYGKIDPVNIYRTATRDVSELLEEIIKARDA